MIVKNPVDNYPNLLVKVALLFMKSPIQVMRLSGYGTFWESRYYVYSFIIGLKGTI